MNLPPRAARPSSTAPVVALALSIAVVLGSAALPAHAADGAGPAPVATASAEPTQDLAPTPERSPSDDVEPTPAGGAEPSASPTTPAPSATPSVAPSAVPSAAPSASASAGASPTVPTPTPAASATPAPGLTSTGSGLALQAAAAPVCVVDDASFEWGIKGSFTSYMTGPIAAGAITTSGVAKVGSAYRWVLGVGDLDPATLTGSVKYPGSVHLTGHHDEMDLLLSSPRIVITSASTAELRLDVDVKDAPTVGLTGVTEDDVVVATIDLAGATRTVNNDTLTYAAAPAAVAPTGETAFAGFYPAGTALDPVTFSVALPGCDLSALTPTPAPTAPAPTTPAPTTPAPSPTATPSTPSAGPTTPACSVHAVAGAELAWGVKESFVSYVTGPIARGGIATSGVVRDGASFRWSGGTGSVDAGRSTGLVRFPGSVTFSGHHGELVLTMSGFAIERTGAGTALLRADVDVSETPTIGLKAQMLRDVVVADLDLASATSTSTATRVAFSGVRATLTASGVPAFANFYEAGATLAPLSFSLPVGATTCTGDGAEPTATTTPSAGPSVRLGGDVEEFRVAQGETVVFDVTGLPSRARTSATVHSDPVRLGARTASAAGAVSYTWKVPTGFAPGLHTFRLAVDGVAGAVSQTFTVLAATAPTAAPTVAVTSTPSAAPECVARVVAGASLTWGIRDSFVSYIEGSIAKGKVSTQGTTRTGGDFRWGGGTGAYNEAGGQGRTSFPGAVTVTGHGDVLRLTFSSPRVVLSGTGGTLVLDVVGTTIDGDKFEKRGVAFASLATGAGSRSTAGGAVTWTGVPATLTAAGASAFSGFYAAGEKLDPVSFTLPLGATTDCGTESGTLPVTGTDTTGLVGLAAACLLAGVGALSLRRRRA